MKEATETSRGSPERPDSPGDLNTESVITLPKARQTRSQELRTVTCFGLPVEFVTEDGHWQLQNLKELQFMSWAESDTRAIKCLPAAIATINAGLIDVEEVEILIFSLRRTRDCWKSVMKWEGIRPFGELYGSRCAAPAIAFAAAHSNDATLESWLAALLRTPLAPNLTFGSAKFGPKGSVVKSIGLEEWWLGPNGRNSYPSWKRTADCVRAMPPEFWQRLASHPSSALRNLCELIASQSNELPLGSPTIPGWLASSSRRRDAHLGESTHRNRRIEAALSHACLPSTSDRILRVIAESRLPEEVCAVAVRNKNASPQLLARLSSSRQDFIREAIASHPNTTRQVLATLIQDDDLDVALEAISHQRVGEAMIRHAMNRFCQDHRDPYLRWRLSAIGSRITSAPKILTELSRHRHRHVRTAVVNNPSFPTSHLWRMAADRAIEVRQAVASRPKVSRNILSVLARDPKWQVRKAVAERSATLRRDLELLSSDTNSFVRRAVAGNERTPMRTLRKLSDDQNHLVRRAVAGNSSTSSTVLKSLLESDNLIYEIASNPAASPELLREIRGKRAYRSLRERLALNPSTPLDLLQRLAEDRDKGVRHAVSHNPQQLSDELRAKVNRFNLHCSQWEDEPHCFDLAG